MAMLKCKMCGGNLEIVEGATTATCEYCGSMQTVPKADGEKKLTLFGRANRLRAASEFDKAAGVYETIVADFPEEAEAYWGLVLCRYGIEYVDDPKTGKKVPTCHRSSFDSVLTDGDYEQTLENADPYSRRIYREEAKQIEELRKDIIAASANEEPYDIFICYKESAPDGQRTLDSVLAQDVYDALTAKGYRVFFARITLEDRLGAEYEPVIFAALHSAKIMLAVGTDYEYFNAVWVKNEWGRYLKLMEKDREKHLIPCYKGIDAYDMPPEFAKLQAQDLGKVGATQDLLRGVEKILPRKAETVKETVIVQQNAATEPLLKRAFMFLEDGDWKSANEYCEKVLDMDPECAMAYLGKLMAELKVAKQDDLKNQVVPFDGNKNYQKAIRFGDNKLVSDLTGMIAHITTCIEKKHHARIKHEEELRSIRERLQPAQQLLSAKEMHTVALKADGTVVASGWNDDGQCEVSNWKDVVSIAAGMYNTVGLKADGTVITTETQDRGKCDWKDIVAIAAADWHTVGLRADGTVVAEYTGYEENDRGQYNVSDWKDIVSISAGAGHTVGLKSDGTVVATEYTGEREYYCGQCDVSDWKDIVSISAGAGHTVGLKSDGTVVATKFTSTQAETSGECEVSDWKDIVAISAGFDHTVGLKSDGTVVSTKYIGDHEDYHGQCEVSSWKDIIAISAATGYTVGLKADGTLVSTKYTGDQIDYYGQCKVSGWKLFKNYANLDREREEARIAQAKREKETRIIRAKQEEKLRPVREKLQPAQRLISTGRYHTVGVNTDGTVSVTKQCGDPGRDYGQFSTPNWNDIVAVAVHHWHSVGLKADGTVVATEYTKKEEYYCGQCEVSDWRGIVAVSAGVEHTVGLRANGTVIATKYIWDPKEYRGQCEVSGWRDIVAISAGWKHTVGLKADGTVVAVGWNKDGQCEVSGWTNIVAIAAGFSHTVGLKADGTTVAVGNSQAGRIEVSGWKDIVAISAGWLHTVGLKADGTLLTTKYIGKREHYSGECEVSSWKDVVAVFAGHSYTVGLKADGTVVATKFTGNQEENHGQCDVTGWKLFESYENLDQEREDARIAKAKRDEEIRIATRCRQNGVCQHCGGEFKGLFTKKCSYCGKQKDY